MGCLGLEPRTIGLKVRCSTIELTAQKNLCKRFIGDWNGIEPFVPWQGVAAPRWFNDPLPASSFTHPLEPHGLPKQAIIVSYTNSNKRSGITLIPGVVVTGKPSHLTAGTTGSPKKAETSEVYSPRPIGSSTLFHDRHSLYQLWETFPADFTVLHRPRQKFQTAPRVPPLG